MKNLECGECAECGTEGFALAEMNGGVYHNGDVVENIHNIQNIQNIQNNIVHVHHVQGGGQWQGRGRGQGQWQGKPKHNKRKPRLYGYCRSMGLMDRDVLLSMSDEEIFAETGKMMSYECGELASNVAGIGKDLGYAAAGVCRGVGSALKWMFS